MTTINPNSDSNPALKFIQGGSLAGGVASFTSPGAYLSNMIMSRTPPKLKNCFRGVGLTSLNDVPAAAVSFGVQSVAMKYFINDSERTSQKLIASGISGACAGVAITPGEMVVLKFQQNKQQLSMLEIAKKVYKIGGPQRLFIGAQAMAFREACYTSSYFVLGDMVAELIKPVINNEELRVGLGGLLSGVLVGAVTTPIKMVVVQKQNKAFRKNISSYKSIVKKLSMRSIALNAVIRAPTVGFAALLLTEGRRHLLPV